VLVHDADILDPIESNGSNDGSDSTASTGSASFEVLSILLDDWGTQSTLETLGNGAPWIQDLMNANECSQHQEVGFSG
jgi:hypothetical protein